MYNGFELIHKQPHVSEIHSTNSSIPGIYHAGDVALAELLSH